MNKRNTEPNDEGVESKKAKIENLVNDSVEIGEDIKNESLVDEKIVETIREDSTIPQQKEEIPQKSKRKREKKEKVEIECPDTLTILYDDGKFLAVSKPGSKLLFT